MRKRTRRHERGVVLVLTMLVLALLLVLGYSFSYSAGVNLATARNAREATAREQAQESALDYALAVLEKDARDTQSDTLDEDWAKEQSVRVGAFEFAVLMVDQNRRLNVNKAVRPPADPEKELDLRDALNRLVTEAGGDATDARALSEAVGALPAVFIEQLNDVKGLNPKLFEPEKDKPALSALLCTHPSRVNVNTASPAVIEALCGDPTIAQGLLRERDARAFGDDAEIEEFLITLTDERTARRIAGALSGTSDFFAVQIRPVAGGEKLNALVRRSGESALPLLVRWTEKETAE